jgi:hypothetical protein
VVASTHLPSKVTSTDVMGAPKPGIAVFALVCCFSLYILTCPSCEPTTTNPSPAAVSFKFVRELLLRTRVYLKIIRETVAVYRGTHRFRRRHSSKYVDSCMDPLPATVEQSFTATARTNRLFHVPKNESYMV